MGLAKILSFSFLNPFVKYTKHSAPQWVEELDLQSDYEKGFLSTRMFFFAYVLCLCISNYTPKNTLKKKLNKS